MTGKSYDAENVMRIILTIFLVAYLAHGKLYFSASKLVILLYLSLFLTFNFGRNIGSCNLYQCDNVDGRFRKTNSILTKTRTKEYKENPKLLSKIDEIACYSVKFTTYFSVLFMEKKFNILINFSDVDGVDIVAIVVTRC